MKEKRRDSKGRILHTGESQRTDGKYLYKYVDAFGNTKYVYAWRLTPTDPTPKGKREKPSLRELEQQIRRDIEDGIDSTGKKMTLCQLYAKQNAQRANVKKSTQKQREQLMRLLKEDKLGARSIDTIKPSDAKEWALRMKDKGFSYNTMILSRLVDTFISRISLTMLPVPNPHNTVCVLSWEEARHWQSRSSGYSSS